MANRGINVINRDNVTLNLDLYSDKNNFLEHFLKLNNGSFNNSCKTF